MKIGKVTLGIADHSGKLKTPGTSFLVEIKDGIPQFSNDPVPSNGKINAFEIRTGSLKYGDAVNSKLKNSLSDIQDSCI